MRVYSLLHSAFTLSTCPLHKGRFTCGRHEAHMENKFLQTLCGTRKEGLRLVLVKWRGKWRGKTRQHSFQRKGFFLFFFSLFFSGGQGQKSAVWLHCSAWEIFSSHTSPTTLDSHYITLPVSLPTVGRGLVECGDRSEIITQKVKLISLTLTQNKPRRTTHFWHDTVRQQHVRLEIARKGSSFRWLVLWNESLAASWRTFFLVLSFIYLAPG